VYADRLVSWPQLLKRWIALSIRLITIQWMSIRETNCAFHWIEIHPVELAYPPFERMEPGDYRNNSVNTLISDEATV